MTHWIQKLKFSIAVVQRRSRLSVEHLRSSSRAALLLFAFVPALRCASQEHPIEHTWDYAGALGPSHWGDLKPEFVTCKTGHSQSPIDIRKARRAPLAPIYFDYRPSPLHIIDNGHTIMVNYGPGSSISVGGKKYALKQFHFHRPSEEKINGRAFDMTVHLVHEDERGNLAVVAVLLRKGQDSPLLQELWNDLPKEKGKEKVLDNVRINLSELLPADRSYYTFSGSLTTPPCSEDVTWFVLKHPASISAKESERFSRLYRDDARPTQPLHDRVVLESH